MSTSDIYIMPTSEGRKTPKNSAKVIVSQSVKKPIEKIIDDILTPDDSRLNIIEKLLTRRVRNSNIVQKIKKVIGIKIPNLPKSLDIEVIQLLIVQCIVINIMQIAPPEEQKNIGKILTEIEENLKGKDITKYDKINEMIDEKVNKIFTPIKSLLNFSLNKSSSISGSDSGPSLNLQKGPEQYVHAETTFNQGHQDAKVPPKITGRTPYFLQSLKPNIKIPYPYIHNLYSKNPKPVKISSRGALPGASLSRKKNPLTKKRGRKTRKA